MGLLDKALVLDNASVFAPDLNRLFTKLSQSEGGLDFPSTLFSGLKKDLKIKRGALFLPDNKNLFVPWAQTGFDQTTSRRIRLPLPLIEKIKGDLNLNYVNLEKDELQIMNDYFSFREISVTDSIILCPLLSHNSLIAILFICEGNILHESNRVKKELFTFASNKFGELLSKRWETISLKLKTIEPDSEMGEKALRAYIEKNNESQFLLASVNVKLLLKAIQEKDSSSISFRIKQDLVRLVKTLIVERGHVLHMESNSLYLILYRNDIGEADLLIHQIIRSISYFYKLESKSNKAEYKLISYPTDGQSAEELLKLI